MAQIAADEGLLFMFPQRFLIHPEGEKTVFYKRLKIRVIREICGFNCGF